MIFQLEPIKYHGTVYFMRSTFYRVLLTAKDPVRIRGGDTTHLKHMSAGWYVVKDRQRRRFARVEGTLKHQNLSGLRVHPDVTPNHGDLSPSLLMPI